MSGPARPRGTLRIGLTGPIGCGKSTVAAWLAARGAVVVDADAIARGVTEPGSPELEAVVARFGPTVLTPEGGLDRATLARVVFADPGALAELEAIVHPAVRPRIEAAVAAAEASGVPVVVVEAIKLVEGGYARACDEVWLVACEPVTQRARLLGRGASADDADRRIAAQGDLAERLAASATRVIRTDGSPAETEALVAAALAEALATRR